MDSFWAREFAQKVRNGVLSCKIKSDKSLRSNDFPLYGKVTAWTGRIWKQAKLRSEWRAKSSLVPLCCSTMLRKTLPKHCRVLLNICFRKAIPLSPSRRLFWKGSTQLTIPGGSAQNKSFYWKEGVRMFAGTFFWFWNIGGYWFSSCPLACIIS